MSQPAIFVASAAAIEKLKATEGADVANSATVRCENPPLPCRRLKLKMPSPKPFMHAYII